MEGDLSDNFRLCLAGRPINYPEIDMISALEVIFILKRQVNYDLPLIFCW